MKESVYITTSIALFVAGLGFGAYGFSAFVANDVKEEKYLTPPEAATMDHSMPIDTMQMDHSTTSMNAMMDGMTMSLEGKSGDAFDEAFIDEMIVHHQGAVEMAEMVLEKSERQELLDLANAIIEAQTGEITMMENWKKEWF